MILIIHILLFIVTNEALMWAFTINRHANWMFYNAEFVKCRYEITGVTYKRIRYTALLTGITILAIGISWILVSSLTHDRCLMQVFNGHYLIGIVYIMVQLGFIHLFATIARCSGLPSIYGPLLSKGISIVLSRFAKKEVVNGKTETRC